jgi:hypothetical protein
LKRRFMRISHVATWHELLVVTLQLLCPRVSSFFEKFKRKVIAAQSFREGQIDRSMVRLIQNEMNLSPIAFQKAKMLSSCILTVHFSTG